MGYNGAGGVIVWLTTNVGYILRINFHNIEAELGLHCDGFNVVPGVDKYFSLLIFLNSFLKYICSSFSYDDGWVALVEGLYKLKPIPP